MTDRTPRWIRPDNLEDALRARRDHGAVPLAGATDLYVRFRAVAGTLPSIDKPIVYIGHLPELTRITSVETPLGTNELWIGAAAVYTDIAAHPATPHILKQTIRELAAPALRNIGTLGGNIGNASPAADAVCTLYALHAEVEIAGASGTRRRVPIREVITGPAGTTLDDDELITAVIITTGRDRFCYYRKVGTRRANALSKIAFAACGAIEDERLYNLGVAIGAVGPTVVSSTELEETTSGTDLWEYDELRRRLKEGYLDLISPIGDQRSTAAYRRRVVQNLLNDFFDRHLPAVFQEDKRRKANADD